jgi:hypothetical protein
VACTCCCNNALCEASLVEFFFVWYLINQAGLALPNFFFVFPSREVIVHAGLAGSLAGGPLASPLKLEATPTAGVGYLSPIPEVVPYSCNEL